MDPFGAALVFHGMAVFVQEGRFRQLLVKTCAALLLGWHVYALLLPFIALGFGGEAIATLRAARASGERAGISSCARSAISSLARSRCVALAGVVRGATNEYTIAFAVLAALNMVGGVMFLTSKPVLGGYEIRESSEE